jgi:hypothetical protein
MALGNFEKELVNYVEQYWYLEGKLPSASLIAKELQCSNNTVDAALENSEVITALTNRGIKVPGSRNHLSPEQLLLANSLLDYSDTRSQKKKLSDLGIPSSKYQAWLKQPAFANYLRTRSEQVLADSLHEANLALVDNVRRGDTSSLKLYYEMVGRWSSKTVSEVNIEFLMMKILEVIQRHVTDPEALTGIAEELGALAPQNANNPAGVGRTPVATPLALEG